MCLILLALRAHRAYPLIVAANRDESYSRPTSPAAAWPDHAQVFAGRDLEQGGTWLGIARNGRFAAVTNYRQRPRSTSAPRSRGELARDFLIGADTTKPYLRAVERRSRDYNGFSLIAGTPRGLGFYSNRGGELQDIPPGVHGLSNHLLNEPWPKVTRGVAVLSSLLAADEETLVARLYALLADRAPAPDDLLPATGIERERERAHSASFIPGETYGTRASTVVLVSAEGEVFFGERSYGPGGTPLGSIEERFELESGASPRPGEAARA